MTDLADLDLQREIERSFGDGPEHRPLQHRIGAGRRLVVRRRLAAAGAVLAVVAVAGTAYAVVQPTGTDRAGQVATDPTPSPSVRPVPWEDGDVVRYRGGELEVRPGAVVHEHIENPFGYDLPKMSDALDLTYRGQRQWVTIDGEPGSTSVSGAVPTDDYASFEDWVAEQARQNGAVTPPPLLRLGPAGEVVAADGAGIVQQTDHPRLGSGFARAGTPTGAAVVVAADGQDYFVVWRVVDGQLDTVVAPPADVVGATFEELLSYARGRFASGEGL